MRSVRSHVARGATAAGALHATLVALFAIHVLDLASVPVAQWQMAWQALEPLDWPVSVVFRWRGWPRERIDGLPYQLGDPLWFFIPCFVFGVLGSAWWAVLGGLAGGIIGRFRSPSPPGTDRRD